MTRKLVVLPNDPIYKYYEKGEIKARYFNPCSYFDEVHIISLTNEDIESEKVRTIAGKAQLYIHAIGTPSLATIFSLREKVYGRIKDIKPQCIRAYNPLLMGWYAVYCGKKLGIPTVLSIHDDFSIWRRRKTYGKGYWARAAYQLTYRISCERYTFKHVDKIICAYDFVRRYAEHFRKDNIEVIYNRVDLSRFRPKEKKNTGDSLKVLCVGRQFKGKDPTALVKAIQGLNVKLTLIGHGPLNPSLRKLVEQLQLHQQVEFIDAVPNEELPAYYVNHNVFAMAIIQPGVCIPVLEAMASGLPIVINRPIWGKQPEIVGELATVVDNTPEGYRQAFQMLSQRTDLRERLGKQVREKVLQYDGRIMEEKEKNVYKDLLIPKM